MKTRPGVEELDSCTDEDTGNLAAAKHRHFRVPVLVRDGMSAGGSAPRCHLEPGMLSCPKLHSVCLWGVDFPLP